MKRNSPSLAEVELHPEHLRGTTHPFHPSSTTGPAPFLIQLPGGATVSVPPGFDFDETLALLTLVREALL